MTRSTALRYTADTADRGEITLKPYGKQTIFVYNQVCRPPHPSPDLTGADKQDNLPVMSAEDMATLDEELKSAQDSLKEQREQLKELERSQLIAHMTAASADPVDLAAVEALPKTQALPIAIKEIEEQVRTIDLFSFPLTATDHARTR